MIGVDLTIHVLIGVYGVMEESWMASRCVASCLAVWLDNNVCNEIGNTEKGTLFSSVKIFLNAYLVIYTN